MTKARRGPFSEPGQWSRMPHATGLHETSKTSKAGIWEGCMSNVCIMYVCCLISGNWSTSYGRFLIDWALRTVLLAIVWGFLWHKLTIFRSRIIIVNECFDEGKNDVVLYATPEFNVTASRTLSWRTLTKSGKQIALARQTYALTGRLDSAWLGARFQLPMHCRQNVCPHAGDLGKDAYRNRWTE